MYKNIPLIIPEVNGHLINLTNGIIASPNCCTTILCLVLYPLHKKYKIKRLVISTYQSASGAGKKGLQELENQIYNYSPTDTIFLTTSLFILSLSAAK